jgi:hypothetical protein
MKRLKVCPIFLALGTASAVACAPSPDDLVFMFGPLVDNEHRPLPGVDIVLTRATMLHCGGISSYPGESDAGHAFEPEPVQRVKTNGDGDFLFELLIAETLLPSKAGYFEPACMILQAEGYTSSIELRHPGTDVALPGFLAWNGTLARRPPAGSPDGGFEIELPPLPHFPLVDLDKSHYITHRMELASGAGVVWKQKLHEDAGSRLPIPGEILEDFQDVQATLVAHAPVPVVQSDNPFQIPYGFTARTKTEPLALPADGRTASSRGASCGTVDACPFTDGKLDAILARAETPTGPVYSLSLTVDLGTPKKLRHAVVRDLYLGGIGSQGENDIEEAPDPIPVFLDGSADNGTTWIRLAQLGEHVDPRSTPGPDAFLGLYLSAPIDPAAPPVQKVRLSTEAAFILSLAEISLFE